MWVEDKQLKQKSKQCSMILEIPCDQSEIYHPRANHNFHFRSATSETSNTQQDSRGCERNENVRMWEEGGGMRNKESDRAKFANILTGRSMKWRLNGGIFRV